MSGIFTVTGVGNQIIIIGVSNHNNWSINFLAAKTTLQALMSDRAVLTWSISSFCLAVKIQLNKTQPVHEVP